MASPEELFGGSDSSDGNAEGEEVTPAQRRHNNSNDHMKTRTHNDSPSSSNWRDCNSANYNVVDMTGGGGGGDTTASLFDDASDDASENENKNDDIGKRMTTKQKDVLPAGPGLFGKLKTALVATEKGDCKNNNKTTEKNNESSAPNKKSAYNNNNRKDSPSGMEELDRLIELAEYESRIDCNRGVGAYHLASSSTYSKCSDNESTNKKKIVTPWNVCQVGIFSRKDLSKSDVDSMSINDLEIDNDFDNPIEEIDRFDARTVVLCVTGTACPSLIAWTKQRLEEGEKLMKKKEEQAEKAAKKRAINSRKRNRSKSTNEPIDLTSSGLSDPNPMDGPDEVQIVDSPPPPKPKFMIGSRPKNHFYRCPCDSNPLCLVSCGGVLNDILERYCDEVFEQNEERQDRQPSNFGRDSDDVTALPPPKRSKSDTSTAQKKSKIDDDSKMDSLAYIGVKNANRDTTKMDHKQLVVDVFKSRGTGDDNDEEVKRRMEKNHNDLLNRNQRDSKDSAKMNKKDVHKSRLSFRVYDYDDDRVKTGPEEIFAQEDKRNMIIGDLSYSEDTQRDLNKIRSTTDVEVGDIWSYAQRILRRMPVNTEENHQETKTDGTDEQSETKDLIKNYLDKVISWNKSLIFVNTAKEENLLKGKKLRLALPPGIENLGATCYLNTQLQCLAQNPVFMEGIFAWRPVNDSHAMNSVMTELQRLLARMLFGKDRKLTTIEFSSALGLEHDEQQDPNEFARLLFDRMGESFQQCDDGTEEGKNLATLLQQIFHGTTTYETKCLACGTVSSRQEGFMDINLPILKPLDVDQKDNKDQFGSCSPESKRRKLSGRNIPYGEDIDTDLQFCLNQYTSVEVFKGDNQYFCSKCDCKQDAERELKLTKLPPVLNVQLSRYVFDREKFVKKKVMDKVLLPSVLSIDQHTIDSRSASSSSSSSVKKYQLCAVMRHHGTSAYSGHYIAEAMDWTTGQWYEFNDESVRPLPSGPSSSVHIDCLDTGGSDNCFKGVSGSQHAYNMYYVDEYYLGAAAMNALNSRIDANARLTKWRFLSEVMDERDEFYEVLDSRCGTDRLVAERLGCRRMGIQTFMFPTLNSLVFPHHSIEDDLIWVDGKILRNFLACNKNFDDHLKRESPLLCSRLCPHGRCHPRDLRNGKLLRKSQYNAYVALLAAERKYLVSIDGMVNDSPIVELPVRTKVDGLICKECNSLYCDELLQKISLVKSIKELYNEVLEATQPNEAPLYYDEDHLSLSEEDKYAYAVAKFNLTKFKKMAEALFKSLSNFDEGGTPDEASPAVVSVGIDGLDLSAFTPRRSFSGGDNVNGLSSTDYVEDLAVVNKRLTCPHGNSKDINNRQQTRYVPHRVWTLIKKVFPDAIDRRIERVKGRPGKQKRDLTDQMCDLCRYDKEATSTLRDKLEEWGKNVRAEAPKYSLFNPSRTNPETLAKHNLEVVGPGSRLVHVDDISNFRASVRTFSKRASTDFGSLQDLTKFAEGKAFPSHHAVALGFEQQKTEKFFYSLRQLSCRSHKRLVKGTIVETVGDDDSRKFVLSEMVVVLTHDEYQLYISSLVGLLELLDRADRLRHDDPVAADERLLDDIKRKLDSNRYHPVVGGQLEECKTIDGDVLSFSDGGGDHKEFLISSGLCDCDDCRKELAPSLRRKRAEHSTKFENVSVDGDTESYKMQRGSGASNPICVDLDSNTDKEKATYHRVKVFEVGKDASIDDAMKHVREAMGMPGQPTLNRTMISQWFVPRRSSRKRKPNFPVGGCIMDENTFNASPHHNVAALKLQLYQMCQVPLSSVRLFIVLLLDDNVEPIHLEVQFDWATRTFAELIEQLKEVLAVEKGHGLDIEENILFLYQPMSGGDTEDTELMDSLLEVSNLGEKQSDKKKKERRPERGFSGTLLQSSSGKKKDNDQEQGKQCPSSKPKNTEEDKSESSGSTKSPAVDVTPKERHDVRSSVSQMIEVSDDDLDDDIEERERDTNDDNERRPPTVKGLSPNGRERAGVSIDQSSADGSSTRISATSRKGANAMQDRKSVLEPSVVPFQDWDTRYTTDDDEDDNDDDFLDQGPTFLTSPTARQPESIKSKVRKQLIVQLRRSYSDNPQEEDIWNAVNLAMEYNPNTKNVEELVETAQAFFQSQKES